jgi:PAS domain S-box-containing protein
MQTKQLTFLNSILHQLADGVIVADRDGNFVVFNRAAEEMLGLGRVDVPPSDWSAAYGCYLPDQVTPCPAEELPLARAIRGEVAREVELFIRNDNVPDGVWLSVNGTPLWSEAGELQGGVVVFRDISSLKRSGEALTRLFNAVEQSADGVMITDNTGRIEYVNAGFEQITGYTRQEVLGRNPRFLKSGIHHAGYYEELWSAILSGKVYRTRVTNRKKSGQLFCSEQTITPMKDTSGRITHFVSVMRDMTERIQLEEQEFEMRLASLIQQKLYPTVVPDLDGYDIAGATYPAKETGGDYFDYFSMRGNCLGIAVGDVSGHGFGPALLMAQTRAYLRSFVRTLSNVGKVVTHVNRSLAGDLGDGHFVTLLLARLDPETRSFVYANAGHPSGYVLDANGKLKKLLKSTGTPLGISADCSARCSRSIKLGPGDLLFALTDGIMETLDQDNRAFGADRVVEFVRDHRHLPARSIVDGLFREVRDYSRDNPQVDDMTVVVCKAEQSV